MFFNWICIIVFVSAYYDDYITLNHQFLIFFINEFELWFKRVWHIKNEVLLMKLFQICSLLRVQRMISTSCHALEYFMNNLFVFDATNYNAALAKLNEIDKEIFYNRSKVIFFIWICWSAKLKSHLCSKILIKSYTAYIYNSSIHCHHDTTCALCSSFVKCTISV